MAARPPRFRSTLRYAAASPGLAAETHDVRMATHNQRRRFWVVDCDAEFVAVARRVGSVPGAPRRTDSLGGGAARGVSRKADSGRPSARTGRPRGRCGLPPSVHREARTPRPRAASSSPGAAHPSRIDNRSAPRPPCTVCILTSVCCGQGHGGSAAARLTYIEVRGGLTWPRRRNARR